MDEFVFFCHNLKIFVFEKSTFVRVVQELAPLLVVALAEEEVALVVLLVEVTGKLAIPAID